MKNLIKYCLVALLVFASCKNDKKQEVSKKETTKELASFNSYGDKISEENSLSASEMYAKFKTMKVGDTVNVKFSSKINEVCSKKGCWMKLPVGETETMVRFKDYGFFMPLDSKDKEVIVEGKAFVKETPVDELKHYAEDAGKSKEEIAKITEPKIEYAFEANGVLMKK
ncbi:DUF4920 domain-containing protein [Polaribacter porphyrae]|uniref:DUF4920 domain-containing protein n=1 Tax=Polaribacter porphyrae TaxID=1137780 RepID=A0A2S7WSI5_9FLAO|nr:DUF4920 domain-containing protein [Polaribacter porphyrae]PQJ80554.1 DUF4920 domain-containing protein [Polaribacter porphyrae]